MLWIILSLVVVATIFDLRTREVPDWIALAILTCAVLATAFGWSEVRWPGLIAGLLSDWRVRRPCSTSGDLGGGGCQAGGGVGSRGGAGLASVVLFWTALAGGLLALVAKSRGKRDFAYVPAIAAGFSFRPCGRRDFAVCCSAKRSTNSLPCRETEALREGRRGNREVGRSQGPRPTPGKGTTRRNRRGQALVEFAVVSLVVYMLLAAILTFGQMLYSAQGLQQAVDTAAREISRTPLPAGSRAQDDV